MVFVTLENRRDSTCSTCSVHLLTVSLAVARWWLGGFS